MKFNKKFYKRKSIPKILLFKEMEKLLWDKLRILFFLSCRYLQARLKIKGVKLGFWMGRLSDKHDFWLETLNQETSTHLIIKAYATDICV